MKYQYTGSAPTTLITLNIGLVPGQVFDSDAEINNVNIRSIAAATPPADAKKKAAAAKPIEPEQPSAQPAESDMADTNTDNLNGGDK